nr:MAG TPA: hypothetical protein [Caudoviricetes sp.]
MKALPINVYRNGNYDCTNNGISKRYDRLLLVCADGYIDIDETNIPENAVKIVERQLFGKTYRHIEPIAKATELGYMYGGNIAYSSDSRFRDLSETPLCIHDRQESQELYDMLFD